MKRTITIYLRKKGGLYLIPYGITTQGFDYACEPFEFVSNQQDFAAIWNSALTALTHANRVIPHPEKWGEMTAWFKHAGVKTWQQFASKAKAVSITEFDSEYEIAPLAWDRKGFAGQKEKKRQFSKVVSMTEAQSILEAALNDAA